MQPNPTPKLSGDDNLDLPCSFGKVIPTVVVHSIAATPQFRRKNANYTVILFMARNLWRLFSIPFPPFLFFIMPKHTNRNIHSPFAFHLPLQKTCHSHTPSTSPEPKNHPKNRRKSKELKIITHHLLRICNGSLELNLRLTWRVHGITWMNKWFPR